MTAVRGLPSTLATIILALSVISCSGGIARSTEAAVGADRVEEGASNIPWRSPKTDPAKLREERGKPPHPPTAGEVPTEPINGDVVEKLRERGIHLSPTSVSRTDVDPFLQAPHEGYHIGNASLYIFSYANVRSAEAAADEIPPDADNGMWDWAEDAHYYRCDTSIALLIGEDTDTSKALSHLCGRPFAVGKRRF